MTQIAIALWRLLKEHLTIHLKRIKEHASSPANLYVDSKAKDGINP